MPIIAPDFLPVPGGSSAPVSVLRLAGPTALRHARQRPAAVVRRRVDPHARGRRPQRSVRRPVPARAAGRHVLPARVGAGRATAGVDRSAVRVGRARRRRRARRRLVRLGHPIRVAPVRCPRRRIPAGRPAGTAGERRRRPADPLVAVRGSGTAVDPGVRQRDHRRPDDHLPLARPRSRLPSTTGSAGSPCSAAAAAASARCDPPAAIARCPPSSPSPAATSRPA